MPDPVAAQPTIPDFRDLQRYPTRPPHHPQSFDSDFNSLIKTLARDERQRQVEVPPKPLCDPTLSPAEYEKQFREIRYKLSRQ